MSDPDLVERVLVAEEECEAWKRIAARRKLRLDATEVRLADSVEKHATVLGALSIVQERERVLSSEVQKLARGVDLAAEALKECGMQGTRKDAEIRELKAALASKASATIVSEATRLGAVVPLDKHPGIRALDVRAVPEMMKARSFLLALATRLEVASAGRDVDAVFADVDGKVRQLQALAAEIPGRLR